jgi:Ca2+-binding EF-hand superfamily protein
MATSSSSNRKGESAGCIGCGGGRSKLPKKISPELLLEITAQTRLKEKEVKALYARFRKISPNGFLLPEGFKKTMGAIGLSGDDFLPDRMFAVFDSNHDGQLSFKEFATSLAVMIRGDEADKLKLSFNMAAGSHDGITLDDFRKLIRASATTMSALVAPLDTLSSDEDIERLFNDLSSDEGCAEGKARMISMKGYEDAAQSNEEFLSCLGLDQRGQKGSTSDRRLLRSNTTASSFSRAEVVARRDSKLATPQPPHWDFGTATSGAAKGTCVVSNGEVVVSHTQFLELRERLVTLRQAFENVDIVPKGQSKSTAETPPSVHCLNSTVIRENQSPRSPREEHSGRCWPLCKCSQWSGAESVDGLGPETTMTESAPPKLAESRPSLEPPPLQSGPPLLIEDSVEQMRLRNLGAASAAEITANTRPGQETNDDGHSSKIQPATIVNPANTTLDEVSMELDRILALLEGQAQSSGLNARTDSASEADSDGAGHQATRDLRGTNTKGGFAKTARKDSNPVPTKRQRKRHRLLGPKKGLAVHFGHENWNMVLSMMIGIRMSVARSRHEETRALQTVDFHMKEKFSIIPHLANMFDTTVGKRVEMTRFMDYAPVVFGRIRTNFGITHDEYTRSIGPEQLLGNLVLGNLASLSELSSEGKSGAFFYFTADGKFLIKTVARKEHQLLKGMLRNYYEHIMKYPNTLLCRFFGLHSLRVWKQGKYTGAQSASSKVYFLVMANMFNTPFEIHRRYDLKGSWIGRSTNEVEAKDPTVALRDVDFAKAKVCFKIGPEKRAKMLVQIEHDAIFVASQNIIDYSLLVGIHDIEEPAADEDALDFEKDSDNTMPIHMRDMGGMLSTDKKSLYFFGIIDILTPYDTFKRVEHCVKAVRHDWRGVSCCPPQYYAERFTKFLTKAFDD